MKFREIYSENGPGNFHVKGLTRKKRSYVKLPISNGNMGKFISRAEKNVRSSERTRRISYCFSRDAIHNNHSNYCSPRSIIMRADIADNGRIALCRLALKASRFALMPAGRS